MHELCSKVEFENATLGSFRCLLYRISNHYKISMKKLYFLIFLALPVWVFMTSSDDNSAGKAGNTGSPGEQTCSTTGCHSTFPSNSQGGSITISAPGMTDWQYVPGQTYTISVTVAEQGRGLFGLGFEALTSSNDNAGTLTPGAGTHILTRLVQGVNRVNITHLTDAGLTPNSHTFTFTWTAPSENIGPITFYTAGNAANNGNTASGDHIYNTSQVVTPANTVGLNELSNRVDINIYPNPVVNELRVDYSTKKEGRVQVVIYDTMGRTVRTLVDQNLPAGEHKISTDVSDLANGQYILHAMINGEVLNTALIQK